MQKVLKTVQPEWEKQLWAMQTRAVEISRAQERMKKGSRRKAFVYAIFTRTRYYIGSTVDFVARWDQHRRCIEAGCDEKHKKTRLYKLLNRNSTAVGALVVRITDSEEDARRVENALIKMLRPDLNTMCLDGAYIQKAEPKKRNLEANLES